MNTLELLEALLKKSNQEIHFVLLQLMIKKKLNFNQLNAAYVEYLQVLADDQRDKLIEAESCIIGSFSSSHKGKKDSDKAYTQRCLYFLNHTNRYSMDELNKRYGYDDAKAKQYSWYESNKNPNLTL